MYVYVARGVASLTVCGAGIEPSGSVVLYTSSMHVPRGVVSEASALQTSTARTPQVRCRGMSDMNTSAAELQYVLLLYEYIISSLPSDTQLKSCNHYFLDTATYLKSVWDVIFQYSLVIMDFGVQ